MRGVISSLGLHFQSCLPLKVYLLQAVTHRSSEKGALKNQCWSSTVVTPPGSLCAAVAAAQVRALQIPLGITPVELLLMEHLFASLLTYGSNLELASVNTRKV